MNALILIITFVVLAGLVVFFAYVFIPQKKMKPTIKKQESEREQFIAIISHQLRTPLSIVKGYLEILESKDLGALNDKQKEFVTEAKIINENMITLVNEYLNAVAMQGTITPTKTEINLNNFLQQIIGQFKGYATASNIETSTHFPNHTITIKSDKQLLHGAVENIVANAMKYTAGSGRVTLSLKENNDRVEISCTDTGMGIPMEQQAAIFSKFFRAKNTIHLNKIGSGLGLYIAKHSVDAIGGSISFTSIENKGTTFTITLPKK